MKRHLIGVGGVGMSALATVLIREGFRVSGSDRNLNTPNIAFLKSIGVEIFPDDGSGVDDDVEEVVFSTAIESDNPGLVKARSLGIRLTHRAQALASALSSRKLIAVVGTAGKSTVTAMLGKASFLKRRMAWSIRLRSPILPVIFMMAFSSTQ